VTGPIALFVAVGGCAVVDPSSEYERAGEEVRFATGEDALYHPEEAQEVQDRVAGLLRDGLTSKEAVQVALLNNRALQRRLLDIGLRHADAVQAGLLSNPSLDALVRFPTDDGSTATEFGLLLNLIELWRVPSQRRLAARELDRTVLEVAYDAATLAADTKSAYFAAVASSSVLSVAEVNLATAREFLELTRESRDAGAATLVDVNAAHSSLLEQQVQVGSARAAALASKRHLALLLGGVAEGEEIQLSEPALTAPESSLDPERLLAHAAQHRLDIRSAVMEMEAAEIALPLERRRVLRDLDAGLTLESEGGDSSLGPAIELELPIFDQNQAQIAKAELRYAMAQRRLEELSIIVAHQVREAHARYALAQETAHLYQTELLPLREDSLELARESFAAGKTGFLSVLEAQERLLTTRRDYVGWLESAAKSVPALEAACGRPLAALLGEDSAPHE